MTRLLVIMGSGETTPTMVSTHQRVFAGLPPDGRALLLDTPYGFQTNADELSAKARAYFGHNVGRDVEVASLRSAQGVTPVRQEALLADLRAAAWLFAGPGSPTYLARVLLATRLPEGLRDRLAASGRQASATVAASAAACTLGTHVVPVYEIYKAGADLHWQPGLDLLSGLDLGLDRPLDAAVIPHFDNTEGGTHDTRYCYLGARRLAAMEELLPSSTWVLGVDEHTALVADLDTGEVRIEGRGGVTVRAREVHARFEAGTSTSLRALVAAAHGSPAAAPVAATGARPGDADAGPRSADGPGQGTASPLLVQVAELAARFDVALADGELLVGAEATVALEALVVAWSTDVLQSDELDRARAELRRQVVAVARIAQAGLHEHRQLVAPHVEALLRLRERARLERRFADADVIRDALHEGGVEVRDGHDDTRWAYRDPLEGPEG